MGLAPVKVYLDTCIVIYLLEEHPLYGRIVRNAITSASDREFYSSPLVELECLVRPLREGDAQLVQRYLSFFETQIVLDILPSVYRAAASLRANFRLKTPDALHLATVQHYGCDELWTNDERLDRAAGGISINLLS